MDLLPAISHGLSFLAYTLAALLLWLSWGGRRVGLALILAVVATAIWSGLLTWSAWAALPAVILELSEFARIGGWLAFLGALLGPSSGAGRWLNRLRLGALAAAGISVIALVLLRVLSGTLTAPLETGVQSVFIISGLILVVLGLVMLEQIYRNSAQHRQALTFLCVGVGALLAYDLYIYSNTLLFQRISPALWDARGLVNALCVPLLLVAARRNTDWRFDVFVSRDVAFHSTVIVAAGAYLVVFAIGGYYVRDFGGTWGEFAQIVVFAAGAITLGLLLTSESLRRRLRVLISKHFFNKKYDYREEWLRVTSRLAEEDDGLDPYARSVHVIADIFDSPAGAVWRKAEAGFEFAGGWQIATPGDAVVRDDCGLVEFLRSSQWVVDVKELHTKPELYGSIDLPPQLPSGEGLWLIVPLWHRNTLRGFVTLDTSQTSKELTWEDRDLLKTLARQIAAYLSQYEDAMALAQARQFEAFSRLTAFLMHDLKNLIAQQSLIVKNAARHRHNPEFIDDAFDTIGASVKRMERLLEHLQRRRSGTLVERVEVSGVLREAVQRCADRAPQPVYSDTPVSAVVEADRDEFTMVILHLVRNAQDATAEDGQVTVSAMVDGEEVAIRIEDSGTGMSEEFIRSKLFQPFYTTKSARGMGIGAHQAREFASARGGQLNVVSRPGQGSCFTMRLPLAPRPS